jgi:hypothetical protein
MKIKTSELTGHALNWAVSQVEGIDHDTAILNITIGDDNGWFLDYLTWAQGGPIIEREKIKVDYRDTFDWWVAYINGGTDDEYGCASETPLTAAMRCYVGYKLGDEVEIPQELLGELK